jgi:aspartate carbamoyltransferase catalytic subunit
LDIKNKGLISIKDIDRKDIDNLFKRAKILEKNKGKYSNLLSGKILGTLFFEPSTRTRMSFESAMKRLGGQVIGFAEPEGTSITKGENLVDTVRVVENYCDALLIRHPLEGAARLAAEFTKIPIINGGTGAEEHPTQALLDLYTIYNEQKKIDNLHIAMMGDLKYGRTISSISYALSNYKIKITLISPPLLKIREEIIEDLKKKGINVNEEGDLNNIIDKIDVLYMTRIQKERFSDPTDYEKVRGSYKLKIKDLENAKDNLIIMHPLPRVGEITPEIDNTKYAAYFKQVKNSVIVRMAILTEIFGIKLAGGDS